MRLKLRTVIIFAVFLWACPGGTPPDFTLKDAPAGDQSLTDQQGPPKDTVQTDTKTGEDVKTGDIVSDGVAKDVKVRKDLSTPDITPKDVAKDIGTPKDITPPPKDIPANQDVSKDQGYQPPGQDDCKPCKSKADCGEDFDCMNLHGTRFCLRKCIQGNGDCLTGYVCKNYCVPISDQCTGCVVTGCPTGKVCDASNGKCVDKTETCQLCSQDWQCGDGSLCWRTKYGFRLCMPECRTKADCPEPKDKYTCEDVGSGIKVCKPKPVSACCPPDRPLMTYSGKCVECITSRDCKHGEECDRRTHTCHEPCPDGQIACASDHKCHDCCSDDDCPGHQKCTNYQCTGDICGCQTDDDCKVPSSMPGQSNTLKCSSKHFCYDESGQCDGEYACCDADSGSQCFDLGSLIGSWGGGGFVPSMCTCGNGAKCPDNVQCQRLDKICSLPMIGGWICHNGKLPQGAPEKVCGDPTKLFSGWGGGFGP